MSRLALWAMILGAVLIVLRLPMVLDPVRARRWGEALPRHLWIGRLLAAADMAWTTWLGYLYPLEWFQDWHAKYVIMLFVLMPVAFVLIVVYLDELLAARALGGLLLLVASPILDAAFLHPSTWRLVMVVLAYGMVCLGMVLVVSPYRLRQLLAFWMCTDSRCRFFGGAGVAAGCGLILLGVLVY